MARTLKQYNEEYIGNLTPRRIILWGVTFVIILAVGIPLLGLPLGWYNKAIDVVSPKNVEVQYTAIYQDYQALQKGAQNVCDLRMARDQSTSDDEKSQRVSQVLASQQLFNRNAADYDARWMNAFQAKYVGPNDVPTIAPTMSELTLQIDGCPLS